MSGQRWMKSLCRILWMIIMDAMDAAPAGQRAQRLPRLWCYWIFCERLQRPWQLLQRAKEQCCIIQSVHTESVYLTWWCLRYLNSSGDVWSLSQQIWSFSFRCCCITHQDLYTLLGFIPIQRSLGWRRARPFSLIRNLKRWFWVWSHRTWSYPVDSGCSSGFNPSYFLLHDPMTLR